LLVEDHEPARVVLMNLIVRRRYEVAGGSAFSRRKTTFRIFVSGIRPPKAAAMT
jgi:hypothetical protein